MSIVLIVVYLILILGPIYLIWAIIKINENLRKVEWLNAQEYTILRIDVPKNNDKSPLAAEQMFASIHGIYSENARYQNHLSFEIVSREKFIQFYLYLPVHLKDFVEGQVYAQYPTVEITEVGDYTTEFDANTKNFAICELKLNKPDAYPIKQFTDFEVDPISGITSVMSKLNEGEEIWFQLVVKPVGDSWQEKGHSMVSMVRSGVKPSSKDLSGKITKGIGKALKIFVMQLVKPGEIFEQTPAEVKLPASVEDALKNIEQKITKLGFESKIRIMAISSDSVSARMKCQSVAAAFKQFNTTNLNGFKVGDIHLNDQERRKDYTLRSFADSGDTFNIAELASIYHLPHSSVSTPNIVWSGSKKGEPPANLPLRENTPEEDLTIIGETNFRNTYRTFGIRRDDRRRHIYIVGKSGTGKSTLIENMAINDVISGRGVIIVDPHGELADKVLSCIPDDRVDDVVIFDPSDREYPIAFNLLETVNDDFKSIVASGFVGIFKKIFGDSWGPRLEHILRNTVFALLDYPGSTMLDIPRMLTNSRFRDKVLEKVKDPVIKEFWLNEFAAFDNKLRTEAVSPILNKVGQFLSSSTIRNIVGQSQSSINIREIMDQQKILVVNLSRGKIGEDNSALLGAMMVTKVQLAAMSRADTTADNRPDTYLYVDEFQNFATESFAVILSEARKYNLNLTMAHQYIAQLPEEVRNAVFGNAGTLITFRVGGADAESLVGEFAPVFETTDLVNLDKYQIYIKLLINGISSPAFSARTLSPVQKLSGNIDTVIKKSRDKYSNTREAVQESILQRSNEEEKELKAEAEAFRTGGLEALLLKKGPGDEAKIAAPKSGEDEDRPPIPVKWITTDAPTELHKPVQKQTPAMPATKEESHENSDDQMHVSGDEMVDKKPSGPRVLKYDSILNGRIYKERTARGGVKWYLGEEVDEEKLAKSKIILDDTAKKIIELSQKQPVAAYDKKHDRVEESGQKKHTEKSHTSKEEEKPEDYRPRDPHHTVDNATKDKESPATAVTPLQGADIEKSDVPRVVNHTENHEVAVVSELLPAVQTPILPTMPIVNTPKVSGNDDIPKEAEAGAGVVAPKDNTTKASMPEKFNSALHELRVDAEHLEEGKPVKIGE